MRTGFIGLGKTGSPMVLNLLRNGFDVTVFDVRREPMDFLAQDGARVGSSYRDVGAHSQVIEVAVLDDQQVETVLLGDDGALSGAEPGTVIAIHSTITPATIRRIAAHAATLGVGVVDAEMSGGSEGAEKGQWLFMVGGDADQVEVCKPIFDVLGKRTIHTGPLGTGAMTKLSAQTILLGTMAAVANGLRLAKKAGFSADALIEVVSNSYGPRQVIEEEMYKTMDPDRTERAGSALMFHKVTEAALSLSDELGVELPCMVEAQRLLSLNLPRSRDPG